MKPVSPKNKIVCALLVPLLALIGLILRNSASHRTAPTGTSHVVQYAPMKPATHHTASPAILQLRQEGYEDSLARAIQTAVMQPEPVRKAPADIPYASHTMATPWRGLRSYFGPDTVHVRPSPQQNGGWKWDARLVSYGYGASQQSVAAAELVLVKNGVEYRRGPLTEWYLNDQRGLEQGFTLNARPLDGASEHANKGPLTLTVSIDTDLAPTLNASADSVAFIGKPGEPVLHYAGLLAWDANGQRLAAHIELRPHGSLALLVDDRNAVYPVTIDPLLYTETKLTAADAAENDLFGRSIAISGNTVVVGAANDDTPAGVNAGSVYVFVRSGAVWIQQQRLNASDAAANVGFGASVGISGETIVVGTPNGQSLVPIPDGSSNTIVFETVKTGAAYVFVRTGGVWTQQQKLIAPDAANDDGFGACVAISGETIAVGSPRDDIPAGDRAGSAYVFTRTGGAWNLQQKLTANNAAAFDSFGSAAAIGGDLLVVGSPRGDANAGAADTGAAYIFVRSGTTWTLMQRLTAGPDSIVDARFGESVAVSGTDFIVGAGNENEFAGSAYVFFLNGASWSRQQKLTSDTPGPLEFFGGAVGISGDTVVVGAFRVDSANGADTGAAFVFSRTGSVWNLQQRIIPSDVTTGSGFGRAVAISGDTIVAAAQGQHSPAGSNTGAAYVFENATIADLLISQAADKTSVKQNDVLTYTITVRNFGPNRAANVIVNDTLPSGTVFKSAHANTGHFTKPPVNHTGVVTWYLGDMISQTQESAQLVVTVTVRGKATLTNTVTVQSDSFDSNIANNSSTLATSVSPGSSGGGGGKK